MHRGTTNTSRASPQHFVYEKNETCSDLCSSWHFFFVVPQTLPGFEMLENHRQRQRKRQKQRQRRRQRAPPCKDRFDNRHWDLAPFCSGSRDLATNNSERIILVMSCLSSWLHDLSWALLWCFSDMCDNQFFRSFSSFTFLLRLGFKARERWAEEAELGCEKVSFISGCLFVVFHDKCAELKLGKYLRVLAKVWMLESFLGRRPPGGVPT